ncbi:C40 family peptidase [Actinacidiphila bryophytorum]|uniref:NlpC/P60 family protein n=1 Tax=Actinacidiphila bryophytorum TaxID=1436133 RepID=A0A9W4ECD8_9ACTN|nr:C40 family peptidase [Actinacidiphila bryophytorum]MBM9439748.1 C40 family peptidase [Actinacidiphila bryophytorum]MBN6546866.1 C40 family peptidase [Actinacidiphila bryophytorum]CAG7605566.1 NlpC/P60 family protein [Actinacidiphila bryophytorum]
MQAARSTRTWLRAAAVCGALLASAALSLPAAQRAAARPYEPQVPVPSATGTPAPDPAATSPGQEPAVPLPSATADPASLPALLAQLQSLYQQTEAATEAYNTAKETADQQRTKAEALDTRLAAQRTQVASGRDQVGQLARQLYRTGGLSPYLSMLGGRSPQEFFGTLHIAQRAVGHQQDVVDGLTADEKRLAALNTQAQRALDAAQVAQNRQAAQKTQIEAHLRQVEALLAGLSGVQTSELQALEKQGADKAQQEFMDSKPLGPDAALRAPSTAGDKAIGYAFAQLGKPYVWGAEGPGSFDCSGLTSQAWSHAGVTIPRTAEQQWAELPHVPLSLLRPGDLVVYFHGATHVALYIGNGLVVQAPHTGAVVTVSPIAANPILGAVRPDLGALPVGDYRPRQIPAPYDQAAAPEPLG